MWWESRKRFDLDMGKSGIEEHVHGHGWFGADQQAQYHPWGVSSALLFTNTAFGLYAVPGTTCFRGLGRRLMASTRRRVLQVLLEMCMSQLGWGCFVESKTAKNRCMVPNKGLRDPG
ncbi:hypothetical protein BT67DRAFT_73355 [Trichocladium antarcticum]|uniref:Uncharacterized protein n=1 Tax=Trichocladium antarcticum TaxID=1450529 RepID=A0AAN6UGX7_9PEZI|nr:hypothetical protein BT67DRAFT_73355 [Trichocladium antarcticum]